MAMSKSEYQCLEAVSASIKRLASLKDATFNADPEKDAMIKKTIENYMQWFEGDAFVIDEVLDGKASYIVRYESYRLRY